MAVTLAFIAAMVFGIAVALQHHVAASSDPADLLRPRLVLRLIKRPLWLLGLGGDAVGWSLQTAALALGSLVVVQPVLTLNVVVALMLAARLSHRRIDGHEWLAVAGSVVGLIVFLRAASLTAHSDAGISTERWLATGAVVVAAIGVALLAARRMTGARQATVMAAATASAEAVMAVVSKSFGDRGTGALLSWEPYILVACGAITVLLVQSTFQLDRPTLTLPILAVFEPLIASTLGVVLFGERIHAAGARGALVVLALAAMVASIVFLARDPIVAEATTASTRSVA